MVSGTIKFLHCEIDGVETVVKDDGRYCCVPVTYKVTLGETVDLLEQFGEQPTTLMMPKMPSGSFAKKFYSLYLSYLPKKKINYVMKMNVDDRESFISSYRGLWSGQHQYQQTRHHKGSALAYQ